VEASEAETRRGLGERAAQRQGREGSLGYPEGLQCTEAPLVNFEADIFQAAVAQVLQFSTVIMAFPAK
jgi:hypothetical protein